MHSLGVSWFVVDIAAAIFARRVHLQPIIAKPRLAQGDNVTYTFPWVDACHHRCVLNTQMNPVVWV